MKVIDTNGSVVVNMILNTSFMIEIRIRRSENEFLICFNKEAHCERHNVMVHGMDGAIV
jgi:hypothetical protein